MPRGVTLNLLYGQSNREVSLESRVSAPTGILFLLGVTTLGPLTSKLVSRESMVTYNPRRMLR